MKTKKQTFITTYFRSIFLVSTISLILQFLMFLSYKMIAGNILGDDAITAVMLLDPFVSIGIFLSALVSDGGDLLVSYEKSRGNDEKANEFFSQGIILSLILGGFITLFYYLFDTQIIAAVTNDVVIRELASNYFKYLMFAPVPTILAATLYAIALYQGGTKYCNAYSIIIVVSNISLSIILCLTMGIGGISLASILSEVLGLIPLILFFLYSSKSTLRFVFRIKWERVGELFSISFSKSSLYLFLPIFIFVVNRYLSINYGNKEIITFGIVVSILVFYSSIFEGLSNFLDAIVSMYLGEENYAGVFNVIKFTNQKALIEGTVISLIVFVFAGNIVGFLGISQSDILQESIFATRIFALIAIPVCFLDVYRNYYVDIKQTWVCLMINFIRFFPLPILLTFVSGQLGGSRFLWIGLAVGEMLSIVAAALIIKIVHKKLPFPLLMEKEKAVNQKMWDIAMSQKEIMKLVAQVDDFLKSKNVDHKKRVRASLAIEESQMQLFHHAKNPHTMIIQCFVEVEDEIRIILRDTGFLTNAADQEKRLENIHDYTSTMIMSQMLQNKYSIIQGNNRMIFHI